MGGAFQHFLHAIHLLMVNSFEKCAWFSVCFLIPCLTLFNVIALDQLDPAGLTGAYALVYDKVDDEIWSD